MMVVYVAYDPRVVDPISGVCAPSWSVKAFTDEYECIKYCVQNGYRYRVTETSDVDTIRSATTAGGTAMTYV